MICFQNLQTNEIIEFQNENAIGGYFLNTALFRKFTDKEIIQYQFNKKKQEKINNLSNFYYNLLNIADKKNNKDFELTVVHSKYGSITETYKWFTDKLPLCTLLFENDEGKKIALTIKSGQEIKLRDIVMYKGLDYRDIRNPMLDTINAIECVDQTSIDKLNAIDELSTLKQISKTVNVDEIEFIEL